MLFQSFCLPVVDFFFFFFFHFPAQVYLQQTYFSAHFQEFCSPVVDLFFCAVAGLSFIYNRFIFQYKFQGFCLPTVDIFFCGVSELSCKCILCIFPCTWSDRVSALFGTGQGRPAADADQSGLWSRRICVRGRFQPAAEDHPGGHGLHSPSAQVGTVRDISRAP